MLIRDIDLCATDLHKFFATKTDKYRTTSFLVRLNIFSCKITFPHSLHSCRLRVTTI